MKKMVIRFGGWGLFLLIAVLIWSCSGGIGHRVIPAKKFVNVLVDIHLADGIADDNLRHGSSYMLDSASLYRSVFDKYGITRAQFDSTMKFYSKHPDDFQKLYNQVTARLKRIEDDLKKEAEKEGKKEETGE